MRKITLLFFLGLLSIWGSSAQVSVGTQDGTTTFMPIYGLYEYSYSQQIIHKSEISAGGDITSISFYYSSGSTTNSSEWTIYMGHTTKTSYESNTDWVGGADLTQVYTGTVTYPAAGNFMEIVFDTPFNYNNTDNLVIAITETEPGYGGTINFGKTTTIADTNRGIYFRNDNLVPDPMSPPTANGRANFYNNMILGGIQHSCPAPTNVHISSITATVAEIGWTENGTATTWNIEYGETGFVRGSGTLVNGVTSNPYAMPITVGQEYDFYVQSDCGGGDESVWVGPYTFTTSYCGVSSTNTGDYLSGVSSSGAVVDVNYTASSQPAGSYADMTALNFQAYETLTFDLITTYVGGANGVNVWIDWNQNMNFDSNELVASLANSNASKTLSIEVPAGTPIGNYRMRVRGMYGSSANPEPCGNVSWGSTVDFTLSIITPPTCLPPNNLEISNVTETTADLAWNPLNGETEWLVVYGPDGFDPNTAGTSIQVQNTPSTTLTNLISDSPYQVYVKAICDATDQSAFSTPKYFFTGYCSYSSTTTSYYINNFYTENGILNISNMNSGLSPNGYGNFSHMEVVTYPTSSFDFNVSFPGSGTYGVNIWIDFNGDLAFDESEKVYGSGAYVSSASGTINIPATVANGSYRMRVVADWLNTNPVACGTSTYGEAEDYTVVVNELPTCLPPLDLGISNITSTTLDLGWTERSGATEWEIEYGAHGFTRGTGTLVTNVTTNPYTLTIVAGTEYDFYVRSICSSTDSSYWAGPYVMKYCGVSTDYTSEYLSLVKSEGAVTDVNYTATSQPAGSYSDQTQQILRTYETQSFEVTTTYSYNGTNGVNIWVDWNRDMNFDNSELVVSQIDANTTKNFTLTIPAGTPQGDYRIRVRGQWNALPPACGNVNYGSTVDFTLSIVDPPSCLAPTNLTITAYSHDSVDINWTENGTATEWQVVYGPTGFDPQTGGSTQTVQGTPQATVTGLSPNTTYDIYVKSICAPGDESFYSVKRTFTTSCVPGTIPFFEGFESGYTNSQAVGGCWTQTAVTGTQYWTANNNQTTYNRSPRTGNWSASLRYSSEAWMFYPLDLEGGVPYELEFYARQDVTTGVQIEAALGTMDTPAAMTTSIIPTTAVTNGAYQYFAEYFMVPTSGTYFLGIRGALTSTPWYLTVDDISVTEAPGCLPVRDIFLTEVSETTAVVGWTPNGTETNWKVIYGEAGFDPATGGTTLTAQGTPEVSISGLQTDTKYDVYVIAVCDGNEESPIVGPMSFWTLCVSTGVPYLMDFETATIPQLPNCTDGENLGNGNMWETLDYNSNGYNGNVLVYRYSTSSANAWFYTQGIELFEGIEYKISYRYGNVSPAYTEKMKVAYGTSPIVAQMTNQLADHPTINQGAALDETVEFTVAADGVYYFGFNVYSNGNQFNLYLDDIHIDFAVECEPATDLEVVDVTGTTVTVSWTESSMAVGGYTVNVFDVGANPTTATPVASETVPAGVTTATLTGLEATTTYDIYIVSYCEGGNSGLSSRLRFATIELGVEANAYTQITYYPNPVQDQLTVSASDMIENITVYNLLGQVVMQVEAKDKVVSLDMSSLSAGTYLLKTNVADGVSTYRVIKE